MHFILAFCPVSLSSGITWLLSAIILVLLLLPFSVFLLIQERKSVIEALKKARACQAQQQADRERQGLEIRQERKRLVQAKKQIWQLSQEIERLLEEIQRLQEAVPARSSDRKVHVQQEEARLYLEQQREQQQLEENGIYQALEEHLACVICRLRWPERKSLPYPPGGLLCSEHAHSIMLHDEAANPGLACQPISTDADSSLVYPLQLLEIGRCA
jgi:hypothetical protein